MNAGVIKALLVAALAGAASYGTQALKPTQFLVEREGRFRLEDAVPKQFGDWALDPFAGAAVVNPQQQEALNKIYNQLLSRVYVDGQGHRIMMSVAYGEDQRDGMTVHYPEICYPAQGFELQAKQTAAIQTPGGTLPVRQLVTRMGSTRTEPVTYWVMIGHQPTLGGMQKKLIELNYAVDGVIPDGLLFRVSSVDRDTAAAFALQERFVQQLVQALQGPARVRLTGLR
ncbi:exosortase-associated protein EpsI, B-type [Roseateles sp. BYS87W]|uniref:Exosortase-associated protein EpsI, B-type n=1 Tax=Pelomonas baiyunensis TaxID=3299026 RepID=A0ABW7H429_9BURK